MTTLGHAVYLGTEGNRLQFRLSGSWCATVFVLESDLLRVLFTDNARLRTPRTWSIAPAGEEIPWAGRDRLDCSGFSLPAFAVEETSQQIILRTDDIAVVIALDPFRLTWKYRASSAAHGGDGPVFAADRPTAPYWFDSHGTGVAHYLVRDPADRYFGLGDKTGPLNRHGRRYRMLALDAFAYDPETTDPLYKHIPFYLTCPGGASPAHGWFYDNLATSVFDMGCEIDAYHGPYRYFAAEDGDLDYYLILGPCIRDVVEKFTKLTGPVRFGPKWALGYSGSTMAYTEADNAQARLEEFVAQCQQHQIPCEAFHLSSGYTTMGDTRYVFTWNRDKIPDPHGLTATYHAAGMRLIANVKPCLLRAHPRFAEAARAGLFIADATGAPLLSQFWGGEGAYLDFTNPAAVAWWKAQIKTHLLDYGIDATWNDNNEFEIWHPDACCHGFGTSVPLQRIRALQALLMMRASWEAQMEHAPDLRPHVISRSGCPGMQRYGQTWTGDNHTDWRTLRYNIRTGLGLSLSGVVNMGHDVGGFAGPAPEPELFVRWMQNGIFQPRFTIHSWNDDGTVTEPWMYPEVLDIVRQTMGLRYRLLPYLYTLYRRACTDGVPIVRPTFYDFDDDPQTFADCDDFMFGPMILVASVVERSARERRVYLPSGPAGWTDFHTGAWYASGQTVTVPAPLAVVPLLVPDGAIIPMAGSPSPVAPASDRSRVIHVFPHRSSGCSRFRLYEDDGATMSYAQGNFAEIEITMEVTQTDIRLQADKVGSYQPAFDEFDVVLSAAETRTLWLNDQRAEPTSAGLRLRF